MVGLKMASFYKQTSKYMFKNTCDLFILTGFCLFVCFLNLGSLDTVY